MGLNVAPAKAEKHLDGFGAAEIYQEVGSLFSAKRERDTAADLSAKTLSIADRKLRATIGFSYLFPHESRRSGIFEHELERFGYYLEFTKNHLQQFSPNSWKEFIKDYSIPLIFKANVASHNLVKTFATRKPAQHVVERTAEYEVLNECAINGILDDVRKTTKKYVRNEAQKEYLLDAVLAALSRIYQGDAHRLVSRSMLQHVSKEALFMYAFVLSKLERRDVFSSYARKENVTNKIPVQWDFSWN